MENQTLPENRPISADEAAVVSWMLRRASVAGSLEHLAPTVDQLRVVEGRSCGCPSIDFKPDGQAGSTGWRTLTTRARRIGSPCWVELMKKEYDFSRAKRNPYAKRLKRQVTIRLDEATIGYFKQLAQETGVAYQTLINLYLRGCAASGRKLSMRWQPGAARE